MSIMEPWPWPLFTFVLLSFLHAMEGSTPRPTGRLIWKVERQGELQGERDSSLESSETPRGQEEIGVEGPGDPERYLLGRRQLYLYLGPSTKGPSSTPRIVRVKVREPK